MLITLLTMIAGSVAGAESLYPLRVQGNQLIANGKPIRLRGLDWGWWHLYATRYSETDMQDVAKWKANCIRLSFSYNDLETNDNPPVWKENGFKDLDDVVQWGKNHGIYVILDMHTVPGGQSYEIYCDGGHNLLWTDDISQTRFVTLWSAIARRYHDHPEVAAYELINEPTTRQKSPEVLRQIDQRAVDAIRKADPDKVIIVGGDRGSGMRDLVDTIKLPDNNILYTFHWYVGAGGNEDWISTERQEKGISGNSDWVKVEKTFTAPPGSDHMSAFFRSLGNSNSAWFDDIEVKDASGKILESDNFNNGTQGYHPESFPETMSYDPIIGHTKPGSLKSHDTTKFNDWAGWVSPRLIVQPGTQYTVSGWMKLENATGETYMGAMFFRINTQLDPDQFKTKMLPAIAFANKFNVPVYVGEFGCDASDKGLQVKWVNASIALFEKNNLNWTYWNDRETSRPTGMGLHAEHPDGSDWPVNDRLLSALRAGWNLNQP
jgi:endoglucanase